MATFNVGEGDEIQVENPFTAEMEAELEDLQGRYETDKTSLSAPELIRMYELREMRVALDQEELIDQINQTRHEAGLDADLEEEDADADERGAHSHSEDWGVPPTKLRSTKINNDPMSKLEKRMRDMVKTEFYAHLDRENTTSGRENFVKAPKTGINTMLSRAGENVWKVRTRNMTYGGPNNTTHDLAYCLSIHREISEKASLTANASIDLLKRILLAEPFKLCQNLHKGNCDIERIYVYLQKTFKDSVSASQASKLLLDFMETPNIVKLSGVTNRIMELAILIHSEESESMPSTATTAISSLFGFINRYYPRVYTAKIRRMYLQWAQRSGKPEALDGYFHLVDVSEEQLAGLVPSYALIRRSNTTDPKAPAKSQAAPQQHARPAFHQNMVNKIEQDDEESDYLKEELMPEFDNEDFDQINEIDGSKKTYPTDPSKYREHIKCKLCNGNAYTHAPPFWRWCTVFVGQIPSTIQCRTCLGYHQNQGNIPCTNTNHATTRTEPSKSTAPKPVQVYQ